MSSRRMKIRAHEDRGESERGHAPQQDCAAASSRPGWAEHECKGAAISRNGQRGSRTATSMMCRTLSESNRSWIVFCARTRDEIPREREQPQLQLAALLRLPTNDCSSSASASSAARRRLRFRSVAFAWCRMRPGSTCALDGARAGRRSPLATTTTWRSADQTALSSFLGTLCGRPTRMTSRRNGG